VSADDWIAIAILAPAIGVIASMVLVPGVFDRLPWAKPGRPANAIVKEASRLARLYELAASDPHAPGPRPDWRHVLGLRRDLHGLEDIERAYRERLRLLEDVRPRDETALNGLHRAARDARALAR